MMKKLLLTTFVALSMVGTQANVNNKTQVQPFSLKDVRLLPSRFQDNMKRDSMWMMSIPVNQLLHSFRNTAGVFSSREGGYMTMKKLAGWESLDCDLRGHITGHLLSAYASLYAQTGSEAVKAKADSLVQGLREVQQAYGRGGYLSAFGEGLIDRNIQGKSVWAPFYTLHKLVQGMIDQYQICGNETALEVACGMGNWAYRKLQPLSDETRRRMIRNEFGGFNDAMYQLYAITQDEHYLWVARFFYHNDKVDPLKQGNKDLGTNHANTFIPKLLGEAQNYELFGEKDSRTACETLFKTLTEDHAFVTGEVSDKEHLFNPQEQSKHLTGNDGENCCTYNLLKLGQHLFSWNPTEEVAAYTERALYNHILGQQDPKSSMVCYFTPLQTGCYRLYSTRDSSFWCCVGSGFESHVSYAKYIYAHSANDLYVNLFIPSTVDWEGTRITQTTRFPEDGKVVFRIDGKPRHFTLQLRRPEWATWMKVNGKKISLKSHDFYALTRNWKSGDKVEIEYGMALHEESTKDDPSRVALLYGPIVLGGELQVVAHPFSDPTRYNDYYGFDYQVPQGIDNQTNYKTLKDFRQETGLRFHAPSGILVRPFYDIHHQRYVVYWNKKHHEK